MIKTETTVVEATTFKRREPLTIYNTVQGPTTTPMEICEGDLEGTYFGPDENFIDANIDLPYDITVVWLELDGDPTQSNSALGYGGFGESATLVNFDGEGTAISQTSPIVRHTCNQPVPQHGFLQLQTGDWTDNDLGDGTMHYKIHYTYRCADGDPI